MVIGPGDVYQNSREVAVDEELGGMIDARGAKDPEDGMEGIVRQLWGARDVLPITGRTISGL